MEEVAVGRSFVKRKVVLVLGFDGSAYRGIQKIRADDGDAVENALEAAFFKAGVIRHELECQSYSRSSRTDKGVHAACTVVALKAEIPKEEEDGECLYFPGLVKRINEYLPEDIRIFSAARVPKTFDSKMACSWREYEYILPTQSVKNLAKFERALKSYEGYHSFHNLTNLKKVKTLKTDRLDTCIHAMHVCPLSIDPNYLLVSIRGQSFYYNQIRMMVATAVAAANSPLEFSDFFFPCLNPHEVVPRLPVAPAHGLLLVRSSFGNANHRAGVVYLSPLEAAEVGPQCSLRTICLLPELDDQQQFKEALYAKIVGQWKDLPEAFDYEAPVLTSFEPALKGREIENLDYETPPNLFHVNDYRRAKQLLPRFFQSSAFSRYGLSPSRQYYCFEAGLIQHLVGLKQATPLEFSDIQALVDEHSLEYFVDAGVELADHLFFHL